MSFRAELRRSEAIALTLSFLVAFQSSLWASSPPSSPSTLEPTTPRELRELELAVRLNRLLFEMDERITKTVAEQGDLTDHQWQDQLRTTSEKIFYESLSARDLPPDARPNVESIFRRMDFARLGSAIARAWPALKEFSRKHGVPGVAALVGSTVMNTLVPVVLVASNLPELVPLSLTLPYGPGIYGAITWQQRRRLNRKLIELHGGPDHYRQVQEARLQIRRELGLRGFDDMLVPFFHSKGETEGIVVSQEHRLSKWMKRAGWDSDRLTYESLLAFLRRHRPKDSHIESIATNATLSKDLKTVLLLNYVNDYSDHEIIDRLRTEFSSAFVKLLPVDPALAAEMRSWATGFIGLSTPEELSRQMSRAPRGVKVATIARAWQELIRPQLGESLPLATQPELSRLEADFLPLLADSALASKSAHWNSQWQKKFETYLAGAFPSLSCQKVAEAIAQ